MTGLREPDEKDDKSEDHERREDRDEFPNSTCDRIDLLFYLDGVGD